MYLFLLVVSHLSDADVYAEMSRTTSLGEGDTVMVAIMYVHSVTRYGADFLTMLLYARSGR